MSRCKWSLLSLVFAIMAPPMTGDSRAVVAQLNRNALLPCDAVSMIDDCHDISWTFRRVNTSYEVTLVQSGLAANQTLTLIRSVVEEDVGLYFCRYRQTTGIPISLFVLKVLYAVIAVFVAALLTLVCVTVLCWRHKAKRSQSDNCHVEEEEGDFKVVYSAARTAPPPVQTNRSALNATAYKP